MRQNSAIWKRKMPEAISNTFPLLYLHQIGVLDWLPSLFGEVWVPAAIVLELEEGGRNGWPWI